MFNFFALKTKDKTTNPMIWLMPADLKVINGGQEYNNLPLFLHFRFKVWKNVLNPQCFNMFQELILNTIQIWDKKASCKETNKKLIFISEFLTWKLTSSTWRLQILPATVRSTSSFTKRRKIWDWRRSSLKITISWPGEWRPTKSFTKSIWGSNPSLFLSLL